MRWRLVPLIAAGCADDTGDDTTTAVTSLTSYADRLEQDWRDGQILLAGDGFSDDERRCIDDLAGAAGITRLPAADESYADADEAFQRFYAAVFDDCTTDAHLLRWITTDMDGRTDLRFSDEQVACFAPLVVEIVRTVGFRELGRVTEARTLDLLAEARATCGIGPPTVTVPG